MITFRRILLLLLGTLLWAAPPTNSTVLFGNLSAPIARYDGVATTPGPLFESFSTGSSAVLLTDVQVNLDLIDGTNGTISVGLYSDSSATPGSLLRAIGTPSRRR